MTQNNNVFLNGYCRSRNLPIDTIRKILISSGYIRENEVILPKGREAGINYHIDKYKNQKITYPETFLDKIIEDHQDMIHQIELESILSAREKRMKCLEDLNSYSVSRITRSALIPNSFIEQRECIVPKALGKFNDFAVVSASFVSKKNDHTDELFYSVMEATILDGKGNLIFDGLVQPAVSLNGHLMETTGIIEDDYRDDAYKGYNIVDFAQKLDDTLDHFNVITISAYSNNSRNTNIINKVISHLRMYRDSSFRNNDFVMYQKADRLMNSLKKKKSKIYDLVPLIRYLWYMQYPTLNRLCRILNIDTPEVTITRYDAYALLQCIAKITDLLEDNHNVPTMTEHRIHSVNKLKTADDVNNGKYNLKECCSNIGEKAVYDLLVALTADGRIQVDQILPIDHERKYLLSLLSMEDMDFNHFEEFIEKKRPGLNTEEKGRYRMTLYDPRCRIIIAKKYLI